ncbi:MAG TPA: SDR family oxidoreductase [Anaerolineales bacterium]|nr:SDR family oxidoreductase [Anaerolineales bacterium]
MKILFLGGTGLISSACAELAVERGHELFILNRSVSKKYPIPRGATLLQGDVHADASQLAGLLAAHRFDAVVDFIAYAVEDVERDIDLFRGRTEQFVFISSASAYQKPPENYLITEETPLVNPFWQYSRDKIACEDRLMQAYREDRFPVTLVRPSHTYGPSQIPLAVDSWEYPWTIVDRMRRGQKLIIPGDGTSLWVLTWNADFAKGLLGLLGNPRAVGEAFHITSDLALSWNQIYREVYQALGLEPNVIHIPSDLIAAHWPPAVGSLIGDKANSAVFDNAKIRRFVPDFRCEVKWPEGVRRSIKWHEDRPQFQAVDQEMNAIWDKIIAAYEKAFPGSFAGVI